MATQKGFPVTSGGKERVDRTVQALTLAFRGDPVYTWLLHTFHSSDHDSVRRELLRAFFTQCALNDGVFIEVDNYGSCGLLIPPGATAENPWTLLQAGIVPALWNIGLGTFKRAFLEYAPSTERMMEQAFTKEERKSHWYVFIMGTSADRRQQGLSSALIHDMQEKTRADGRPIWLEATTEASQNLYLKHGFQNHGEIILGKGKVGRDGMLKKAGEGIVIWSMSWRP